MPKLFKHIALLALASLLVGSCIENDIPYPLIFGEIIEFEVDGQIGEAQIDASTRTISIEVADSVDLTQLRVSRFSINPEAKAPIQQGSIISCIDSLPIVLETYQFYRWVLRTKQPFAPVVRFMGQQGEAQFDGDTIRVSVSSVSQTAIEELRLAPGNPVYTPALDEISDFRQTVEILVKNYGRTKRYVLVVSRISGYPIPSIEQFEVEDQLGEAQIDVKQRSISIEVSESTDLQHLRLAKLTLSEADATASVAVGDEISCVDSLLFSVFDVDGEEYPWKLYTKQQYTPVVRLKGQLGNFTINNDTIRVIVDNMAAARVEELRLAPGKPTYTPDPFGITDFTQPIDIDVSSYGKTKRYTLVVIECSGSVISVRTKQAEPSYTTATLWASIECCEAVQPYFEYRPLGDTDWQSTTPGHIEAGATAYTATLDGLKPGTTYEYRAVAGDKQGDTRTFRTDADPIVSLTTGDATPDVRSATLNANVVCSGAVQVYFEYREQGLPDWQQTATSSIGAGAATHTATIDGLEPATIYEYRIAATSLAGTKYGETLTFTTGEELEDVTSISTGAAEPWTKFAHVSAEAMCNQTAVPLSFEYSKQGTGNWISSTTKASTIGSNTYTITLTGLEPNTTYEYRAVAGGLTGESKSFTTDGAPTVPNLSFDDWSKDGKVDNPWIGNPFWTTGNSGVTTWPLPNKASNNTPTTDAVSGKAAQLYTYDGITLVGLAAGSIYTGEYKTNMSKPLQSTKMGRPYTGRPTTLSGWYKYTPKTINQVNTSYYKGPDVKGTGDKAHIYIILIDWSASGKTQLLGDELTDAFKQSAEVVAYGEFMEENTVSSYTQFNIKLQYRSTTKRPTHIIICATSSYLGSAFTGGAGSTLWVDEFELGFDYVEPYM